MPATAKQFLDAIMAGELDSVPITINGEIFIEVRIEVDVVAWLGFSTHARPRATLGLDGTSAEVYASPGTSGSFTIRCENREDALTIAESIDICLEVSNADILNPDR